MQQQSLWIRLVDHKRWDSPEWIVIGSLEYGKVQFELEQLCDERYQCELDYRHHRLDTAATSGSSSYSSRSDS